MIDTVKLQIPMSKLLREQSEKKAFEYGFSSLQELVRVFLKQFSENKTPLYIGDYEPIKLSKNAQKRYAQDYKEFKEDEKRGLVKSYNSVEELIKGLHGAD